MSVIKLPCAVTQSESKKEITHAQNSEDPYHAQNIGMTWCQ